MIQLTRINFGLKANLILSLFIYSLAFCSCQKKTSDVALVESDPKTTDTKINSSFEKILSSHHLNGSILIYDPIENLYHSNDFEWALTKRLPASTFKIPHTIIGLETGQLSDSTLFKWNGEKRAFKSWEQDHTLEQAFKRSCLPCYQQLAPMIGVDTMNYYLQKIGYHGMKVDSSNLSMFWISGKSAIHQMQQIQFLQRLFKSDLSILQTTEKKIKTLLLENTNSEKNYTIWAKTG